MTTRPNPADRNSISIGGNVTGNVVAGTGNTVGDVVLGDKVVATQGDPRADLVALLTALRAAVPESMPKYDVVVENIDDLAAETAKPEQEAEPPVARRLWQKIRDLLAGASGTSAEVAKLTTDLTAIGAAVGAVFGAN